MITIEKNPPKTGEPCSCCGHVTTRLTRFVYRDGDAHSVYFVSFSEGHKERSASAIVSIGEWGEGSTPAARSAFALHLWSTPSDNNVHVMDAQESLWADVELLGKKLTREEALEHPDLEEVFHITNHMFAEDEPLVHFLESGSTDDR